MKTFRMIWAPSGAAGVIEVGEYARQTFAMKNVE
jgi:hypothetical protein